MKKLFILILFFTYSICISQDFWEPYPIPNDVPIKGFVADSNGNLYACNHGFYVSSDKGQTWQSRGKYYLDGKIVTFNESRMYLQHLAIDDNGNMYMVQAPNVLLISSDKGETWSMRDFHDVLSWKPIDGIICHGNTIFIYSKDYGLTNDQSIFGLSEDHGASWIWPEIGKKKIRCIDINRNNEAWAATTEGFFKIEKEQDKWMLKNEDIVDSLFVDKFIYYKEYIIASSADNYWSMPSTKLNISSDYGKSWKLIKDLGSEITSLGTDGKNYYIGTDSGILMRGDGINTMHPLTTYPGRGSIDFVYAKDRDLYVTSDGLYYSSDNGTTWSKRNKGITGGLFSDIVFDSENNAYIPTMRSLHTKSENDAEWKIYDFLFDEGYWQHPEKVFICADSIGDIYLKYDNGFFVTINKGNTWDTISRSNSETGDLLSARNSNIITTIFSWTAIGYLYTFNINDTNVHCFKDISAGGFHTAINNYDVMGILDQGRYSETSDYGDSWSIRDFKDPYKDFYPYSFAMLNNLLFTSGKTKAYKATNKSTNWTQINWDKSDENDKYSSLKLKRIGSHIFALTNHGLFEYDAVTNSLKDFNYKVTPSYVTALSQDKKGFLYMSCLSGTFKSTTPITSIKEDQEMPGRDYVYPNPASGKCSLFLSGLSIGSGFNVKVYNSIGTEVLDLGNHIVEGFDMKLDINTEPLSSGAYYVKLMQGISSRTIPFAVNK